jgi:hypothetical protein
MKKFDYKTGSMLDKRVRKIIREFGPEGFGLWVIVLEDFYRGGCKPLNVSENWKRRTAKEFYVEDFGWFPEFIELIVSIGLADFAGKDLLAIRSNTGIHRAPSRPKEYRKHKDDVFRRDGFNCVYCYRTEDLSLDHIVPFSLGGSDSIENLVCCCRKCNSSKGAKPLNQWRSER